MLLLSPYERKARLIPGALGIAPIVLAIATLGFEQFPAVASAMALVSAVGGGYFLAVLVADFGRQTQAKLWQAWSGAPATRLLRTRETTNNPRQRDLWRETLASHTGVQLLTPPEEMADPSAADHAIETAVDQVLHFGQDKRFPILLSENAQYGLQRNLYGFRWIGCSIAFLCTAGLIATAIWADWASRSAVIAAIVLNILILAVWLVIPSEQRTKDAGFRYAKQLMRAVVQAQQSTSKPNESTPEKES